MTLWAVVEDYDNGLTWEDNYSYENQLCGLFDIKKYAINHLKDGLDDEWIKNPVLTKGISNNELINMFEGTHAIHHCDSDHRCLADFIGIEIVEDK